MAMVSLFVLPQPARFHGHRDATSFYNGSKEELPLELFKLQF